MSTPIVGNGTPGAAVLASEPDGAAFARAGSVGGRVTARAFGLQNPLVFLVLAFLFALPGLVQVLFGPDDHDVAWGVYVAERTLAGARLYVDLVETNPPLIFVLNMPAALLSRALGISDVLVWELTVCAAIAGSLALCAVLLRRVAPERDAVAARRAFLLVAVVALCAVPATSNVFAQREHLTVALLLPYMIAAAARARRLALSTRLALVVGVVAAVGVALKPFFVLPWALVELYLTARIGPRRAWLRPEVVTIAAFGAVYVAAVVLLTPDYLPLVAVLREVYGDFLRVPISVILLGWRTYFTVLALAAFLLSRAKGVVRELGWVVVLATAGFFAALVVQHKGWEYHRYPPLAGSVLLLGVVLWAVIVDLRGRPPRRADRRRLAHAVVAVAAQPALLIAVGCFAVLASQLQLQTQRNLHPPPGDPLFIDLTAGADRLIREYAAGESVAALSGLPMPMFPAVNHTGVRWASRFFHLWALSGPYRPQTFGARLRYHTRGEMGPAERFVFDGVVDDMQRDPPRLLFVMRAPDVTMPHGEFDYITYFSQDPRFAARIREYTPVARLGHYELFRRGAAPVAGSAPAP